MNDEVKLAALNKQIDKTRLVFLQLKELNPKEAENIIRATAKRAASFTDDLTSQRKLWEDASRQLCELKKPKSNNK